MLKHDENIIRKLTQIIFVAGILINILPGLASAQTDNDSTKVIAMVEKYKIVWDTHNTAALAELFSQDADFIMGNLPLLNGRKAIQNWWQNYFNRQEPERKLIIDINSLRFISDDVAIINITTTTGGKDNAVKELLNRKARGTWVVHQQNGKWLIAAMRGMPTEEDQIIRAGVH